MIDAATGAHIWADRFEGDVSDIFALQDEMTEGIISAITPRLLRVEIELAAGRRPNDLSAYDTYLRAASNYYSLTREGLSNTLQLLHRALEIDPRYGAAASLAVDAHMFNVFQGWAADPKSELKEATRLFQLALSIDDNDPDALASGGHLTAWTGDFDTAIEMVDRAVAVNPNLAHAWDQRGWTYRHSARAEEAVRSFERAIRLSPLDPLLYSTLTGMGTALIELRRFDEAVAAAGKPCARTRRFRRSIAASHRLWLILDATPRRERQQPGCLS